MGNDDFNICFAPWIGNLGVNRGAWVKVSGLKRRALALCEVKNIFAVAVPHYVDVAIQSRNKDRAA